MRSRRLWSGSSAAVGRAALVLGLTFLSACSSNETASSSPSPSPTPSATASATAEPGSPGQETPVPTQVLAPAPDLPVANLCSAQVTVTADGNATPLLCKSGAVNVQAWKFYASVSASVMGIGLNPTEGQVESAICDDFKHQHATQPEETSGYRLAMTYYGWTFNLDPAKVVCP